MMTADDKMTEPSRATAEDTLEEIVESGPDSDDGVWNEEYWSEEGWDEESELKPTARKNREHSGENETVKSNSDISSGESDEAEKLMKELSKEEKNFKNAQRFLIYLVAFLVVAWILFFKVIGITHMPSSDMEPRVDTGDLLIFYRLDKNAKFQDIIVFEKDVEGDGNKKLFVGRVMAAPGDVVDINENNRLVVNGNVIIESSVYYSSIYKRGDRVSYPLTLQDGQYFVLVDDREKGIDSRYFGPVSKDEILGTLITLFRRNKF